MSDDHAAHAISAYGSKINQTPNIDRLAKEGMRFTQCFVVNSICTPSRAAILTGKYSHINGVPVFNRFDGRQPTVAKMLQAAGYYTGMIGKWHLTSDPTGFVQPHYGVRTERYKLIYFNKIDEWELFDLQKDPHELKNVYAAPTYGNTVQKLKTELYRLKKELKDDDQFANGVTE